MRILRKNEIRVRNLLVNEGKLRVVRGSDRRRGTGRHVSCMLSCHVAGCSCALWLLAGLLEIAHCVSERDNHS